MSIYTGTPVFIRKKGTLNKKDTQFHKQFSLVTQLGTILWQKIFYQITETKHVHHCIPWCWQWNQHLCFLALLHKSSPYSIKAYVELCDSFILKHTGRNKAFNVEIWNIFAFVHCLDFFWQPPTLIASCHLNYPSTAQGKSNCITCK